MVFSYSRLAKKSVDVRASDILADPLGYSFDSAEYDAADPVRGDERESDLVGSLSSELANK